MCKTIIYTMQSWKILQQTLALLKIKNTEVTSMRIDENYVAGMTC